MSNATDRGPPAPGRIDATLAQMQAALAEVARQRDQAQGRAVELAVAMASANARIAALEAEAEARTAEVERLRAAAKEWRAMADAARTDGATKAKAEPKP